MIALPALSEKTWKIIGLCAVGLVLLGLVLFGFSKCSDYRFSRDVDKRKANINAALSNIANIQQQKTELEKQEAVEKEVVKIETESLANAVNATNEQRVETNKALSNLDAAHNSNTTNTSVEDLEKLLRRLDNQ